jgi:hypothetical protein
MEHVRECRENLYGVQVDSTVLPVRFIVELHKKAFMLNLLTFSFLNKCAFKNGADTKSDTVLLLLSSITGLPAEQIRRYWTPRRETW